MFYDVQNKKNEKQKNNRNWQISCIDRPEIDFVVEQLS